MTNEEQINRLERIAKKAIYGAIVAAPVIGGAMSYIKEHPKYLMAGIGLGLALSIFAIGSFNSDYTNRGN